MRDTGGFMTSARAPAGRLTAMTVTDQKSDLRQYLQQARDAMLWKLDGLSDYDIRRPVTPTGTNLLGMVKHLAGCEIRHFGGGTFGTPIPDPPDWANLKSLERDPMSDMWATAAESRDYSQAGTGGHGLTQTRPSTRSNSMLSAVFPGGRTTAPR